MKRKIVEFQFEISKNTLLFQSLLRVINTTIIIILALLPGVSLFSQINNESNVIAKTTVEYDCNSPNAIVTFPLNGDGICPSAPLLRWMEVYSINIDGSQSLEARVSADNISGDLMHEKTCVTTLVTYPAGSSASEPFCRYYDICDVGNVLHSEIVAYTEVPNGSPAERYMKLTVPSSTGIIHLVGDYDFGYDGFQIDNGFDVDFQKQDPFPGIDCPGYETPIYNFSSSMTNVSVSSLPLPICGDIGGVTTTSVLDALQADESEYLLTRRNEVYSFRVNITHSNQTVNNGAIQVFYKSNPGTPLQKDSLLLSVTLSPSTSSAVTQSFPISYIPAKGSLGDVLQVQFSELATYYNIYIPVAVEGIIDDRVPALGEFTTPKIPYLILHDPPGDESYASFEATKKVCHATSTTITSSDSRGGSLTLQAGFEGSFDLAPVSANLVSTLAITGSYTVTKTINNFHEKETCLEFKDNIETPRLESKIGHSADVFIGNATKLKYGIYDQVIMENCELSVQQGLVYGPDPKNIMQTQFTLTEADIESDIDTQTNIVNDLSRSLFEREQAYNQAKVWQQILDRNKSNRDHANYPIGRSQSAGTSRTSGFSESTNTTSNLNYDVAIDKGVAIEVKILIAGNGIYGGPELNFNTTSSGGYSTTQESDSAFYYTIYDEEDKIDFDIGIDPDYGTPMFRLSENAATSCPYEGGKRLYAPQIYIEQDKVAPEMGVFKCPFISRDNIMTDSIELELVIYNGDQESPRNFSLWAGKQSGNLPVISVGGAPLVNKIVELGTVPANDTIRRTIVMTKSTSQNRYDNIYLRAFASCMAGNIPGNIEDFPTWIANENDSLIINLTFGGPGNYPPDMDCDGVPDTTDPCPNTTSEGDDDCDGIPNSQDDCPLDPNNTDADLDAIPDCIDLCADQESTLNFERSSAINSDNNADFVSIPHDDALNLAGKDFTVQAWVQPSDDFYKTIIAKGGATSAETNFALVIWNSDVNDEHNGKLGLLLNNEWHYSDNQIPLNRWTHVAVTFEKDGQQAEFYIDGQFSGRKRYSSSATTANSNAMTIGVWELGSIQPTSKQWGFKGSMDELNIWNRKLELAEIQTSMSHALAPFSPGLIAYYKFDGNIPCMAGGSTTLFDSGPNVFEMAGSPFNGTLRSFALDNNCVSNWSEGRNADINKDGLGDICSLNAGLSQDSDNDGYSDLVDLCPNTQDAALHFDGTNWAESVNDANIVGNGSFSLSAWIYPTSDDFSTIISQGNGGNAQTNFILTKIKGDGTAFPLKDHNKIGLYLANGTTAEWKLSTTRVTLNKWTHVAVSISGNTVTFYINGEFDGKQMFSFSNYYAGTGHLYIGRQGEVCNCNYFKGRLDDISIWNKSLNKEEVKSLFAKKFMGNEPNLVAGYNFNNQGVPCQSNGGIDFVIDISGKVTLNLWNFDLTNNNCERNWTKARNQDSDNNGIGDACETSTFACASMAGTGGPGTDNDYFEDCLDFCPLSTETGLQFDGINDFVYVDDNPQLFFPLNLADGDFTLELWVKPGETTQNVPLINKGHGLDNTTVYNLVIIGDQVPQLKHKLGLNMSGEWVFSNSSMKANEWTHIAVTFEYVPKTIRFYINGQLDSQPRILSTNSLYNSDSGRLTLGNDRSGASSKYVGTMEDVIIWDKILSNEQILQTMAAPLQGSESNLVAYYKFDDGVPYGFNSLPIANTLIDSGPNTLNGVLQDFDLVGTVSNWAPGRNNDSDGDGMGDGCDDGSPCPPNYAGMNALDNTLQFSNDYKTNGVIESSQMIYNPINLIYNSATSVNLLPGFQLNKQAVMTVKNDGCNQN